MTFQELQKEVISFFPSRSFREHLARSAHRFSPEDLMAAIYQFVPLFEDRLRLLEALAEISPEVAQHARQVVCWQKETLKALQTPHPGAVYHLEVLDDPEDNVSVYLCADYETCLEMIDLHYERFDWVEECPESRYTITQKRIWHRGESPAELPEDLCQCILGPGKRLLRAEGFDGRDEFGRSWEERESPSVAELYPAIPAWFENGCAVFYDAPGGVSGYALALTSQDVFTDCPDCYLIPLCDEMPRHLDRDTFEQFRDHEHIASPYVEVLSLEELPEPLQDSYLAFYEYLITQNYD